MTGAEAEVGEEEGGGEGEGVSWFISERISIGVMCVRTSASGFSGLWKLFENRSSLADVHIQVTSKQKWSMDDGG